MLFNGSSGSFWSFCPLPLALGEVAPTVVFRSLSAAPVGAVRLRTRRSSLLKGVEEGALTAVEGAGGSRVWDAGN